MSIKRMGLTAVAVLGLGTASIVVAPMAAATETGVASTCGYRVLWGSSAVKEEASPSATIRKWKHQGDLVTGPCFELRHPPSGTQWTAVFCTCAEDGIGWMNSVSIDYRWQEG